MELTTKQMTSEELATFEDVMQKSYQRSVDATEREKQIFFSLIAHATGGKEISIEANLSAISDLWRLEYSQK